MHVTALLPVALGPFRRAVDCWACATVSASSNMIIGLPPARLCSCGPAVPTTFYAIVLTSGWHSTRLRASILGFTLINSTQRPTADDSSRHRSSQPKRHLRSRSTISFFSLANMQIFISRNPLQRCRSIRAVPPTSITRHHCFCTSRLPEPARCCVCSTLIITAQRRARPVYLGPLMHVTCSPYRTS